MQFPGFQRSHTLVNVGQCDTVRNHIVQVQLALQVKIHKSRHINAETIGAHHGTLNLFLRQEIHTMQFDHLARRNHANDRGSAARSQHSKRLFGGRLKADRLERVVHTAAGELPHFLNGLTIARIDYIGSAEIARQLKF